MQNLTPTCCTRRFVCN